MNCEYCVEAISLKTADIFHVDLYLFHCSVFTCLYFKRWQLYMHQKQTFHFKSSQKI